jgi:hypothetical protein
MSSATDASPPISTLQPSTAITATDHGQIVVLVAWLCFTAGVLLSLVRVYIRWPLNALAGKDDVTYAVSALFAIIQTAIMINAVSNGLGRTESELDRTQVVNVAKVSYLPSPTQNKLTSWCDRPYMHVSLLASNSHLMGPQTCYLLPIPIADLNLGYLRYRSNFPPFHMGRQALRLLLVYPACSRIEQNTSRMGSQCADINVRHRIVRQRGHTSGYHTPLVIP